MSEKLELLRNNLIETNNLLQVAIKHFENGSFERRTMGDIYRQVKKYIEEDFELNISKKDSKTIEIIKKDLITMCQILININVNQIEKSFFENYSYNIKGFIRDVNNILEKEESLA